MSNNPIKIKLWRIENVVLMKVLEMPEELRRANLIFNSPNTGMKIYSIGVPELTSDNIYLNGSDKGKDNKAVCYEKQSNEEALDYYNSVIKTIEEYNSQHKSKASANEDIDIYVTE